MIINEKQLTKWFEFGIDGQNSDCFRQLLFGFINIGSPEGEINAKTLLKVLTKLSKRWDKEIDKVINSNY